MSMKKLEIIVEPPGKKLKGDIESLCALEREVFGAEGYPRYFFRQAAEAFGDTFLLCRDRSGRVIGYLLSVVKNGEARLLSMCVEEKLQRKGIGSAMLRHFFDLMKLKSVSRVFATADPRNHAAVNFYLRHGFRVLKLEQDYHGKGHHRYVLKKTISTGN